MRDIDFDELDKAVNRFLDKKGDRKNTEVQKEEKIKIQDDAIKKDSNDVFMYRNATDASAFHASLIPGRVVESPIQQTEIVQKANDDFLANNRETIEIPAGDNGEMLAIKVKNNERNMIHENFDEKPRREHKRKHSEILDDLNTVNFEEPVLDTFEEETKPIDRISDFLSSEEKVLPELKSSYEEKTISVEDLVEKLSKKSNESDEKMILTNEDVSKIQEKKVEEVSVAQNSPVREAVPKLEIPSRPGVHRIDEDNENLVVFGVKNDNPLDTKKIDEDSSAIAVNIIENSNKADAQDSAEELMNDSVKEPEKIVVKTEESENESDSELQSKESKIVSRTVNPENISMEELRTPFVSNPKIEKRPLGSSQPTAVSNFDIKPVDRSKEISRAKTYNQEPQVPMLARDEYSTPVVSKKKKSGWAVFILLALVFAIIGAGIGFAIWYYYGK